MEWQRHTADAATDVKGPPPDVLQRFLQMWGTLFERSKVPRWVIVYPDVAIITLTDFAESVRQEALVMIISLLSGRVYDPIRRVAITCD